MKIAIVVPMKIHGIATDFDDFDEIPLKSMKFNKNR